MAIDEQAAPAGAVTETPAPATEVADLPRPLDAPLTGAAAAKLLAEWEPDSPELPLSNPNTPSEPEAVAAAEEPVEAAQPDSEEEEAVPANEEKAEPETEEPDDKFVHGNAKTRRSDGSVVTVGELKKKADLAEEYERVKPQLEQQFRQLQAREAQLAQREQYAQHVLAVSQRVAQTKLPQPPDPKLATEDPIEHYQQMVRYNDEMKVIHELRQAEETHKAIAAREHQVRSQQQLHQERQRLLEVRPELHDPVKREDFGKAYLEVVKAWGYSEEEAANVTDHRIMHNAVADHQDAKKWREYQAKLAAQKPVVQAKVAQAVPVASPAKREPPKAAEAKADELFNRALKTGDRKSLREALSAFD
jgi:hypothetical protein